MHFLIRSDVWLWWLPIRWLVFIFQTMSETNRCAFLSSLKDAQKDESDDIFYFWL